MSGAGNPDVSQCKKAGNPAVTKIVSGPWVIEGGTVENNLGRIGRKGYIYIYIKPIYNKKKSYKCGVEESFMEKWYSSSTFLTRRGMNVSAKKIEFLSTKDTKCFPSKTKVGVSSKKNIFLNHSKKRQSQLISLFHSLPISSCTLS